MEVTNNLLQIASSLGCYIPQAEKLSINERAQNRLEVLEKNRQKNIEDVLRVSQNIILQDKLPVNQNQIDRDWFTRVINNAQDVSDTEMKLMWSKVLAGEIKHPKSYSLRTLDVLKNMTKDDAQMIIGITPYILRDFDNHAFIFNEGKDNSMVEFSKILYLMELGIIDPNISLSITESFDKTVEDKSNEAKYWNQNVGIILKTNLDRLDFPAFGFTSIGMQILTLIDVIKPNIRFYENCLKLYTSSETYYCGIIKEGTFGRDFEFESILFENI